MSNTLELRGLTVIVTGASSGIGAATARALHDAGARPVLAARRTERLETLSAQLGGALCVQTDVTDAGQVADLVAATLERHGRIDALVNNAGASLHDTTIEQLDLGEFHQVLDLNLVSVIRLMQAVLPSMRRQGFGRIVNISSGSSRTKPGTGMGEDETASTAHRRSLKRRELHDQPGPCSPCARGVLPTPPAPLQLKPGQTSNTPGPCSSTVSEKQRGLSWACHRRDRCCRSSPSDGRGGTDKPCLRPRLCRKAFAMTVRHFTASAIIFDDELDQVLLVHHNKIGKWLYPGGHLEPGQTPAEAAIREVEEETGICTEVLIGPIFQHPTVEAHPTPFAILEVQATDDEFGEHRHIDFIYVLRATSKEITVQLDEVSGVRWVPVADTAGLDTPPDLPALLAEAVRWVEIRK